MPRKMGRRCQLQLKLLNFLLLIKLIIIKRNFNLQFSPLVNAAIHGNSPMAVISPFIILTPWAPSPQAENYK